MDKIYLIKSYKEDNKSLREIGREFGVTHNLIKRRLNSFGIETVSRRMPKLTSEVKCSNCKKPLKRFPSTKSKNNFCNYECYHTWMIGNTRGENSNRWEGGITAISSDNLKTSEFRDLKKIVLEKFPICVMCGDSNNRHVHHIKTRREHPELCFELDNLIALCRSCHSKIRGKEREWEAYFIRIVRKGSELRETLSAKAYDNPQPSHSNVLDFVEWKVQRLMGEDTQTDKPDTSAAPERDEIVRAYRKL